MSIDIAPRTITRPSGQVRPRQLSGLIPAPRRPEPATTAPPAPTPDEQVRYAPVMTRRELLTYSLLLAVTVGLTVRYAAWWFDGSHLPANLTAGSAVALATANVGPFLLLTLLEGVRILQMAVQWVFALCMRSAVPLPVPTGTRVAVLTAIVPSKEPIEVLEQALVAMRRIRHVEPFDVWVLDEEDDPQVRALCERLDVHHFSRRGIAKYNQPDGAFRARTKAGNHNAWRDAHAADYDIVAQMDCDHLAEPDFLEKTLGYFRDPDVAYVIAPQVYYRNTDDSWIARGADEQNFGFSAITQRGANTLGMPIFIGSNHVCRTAALDTVGGYASHIVEDHLTGMLLLTTDNPATGRRWKGVYTEEIISHGEGPSRWSSYLSQQLRWAYGMIDIVQHHSLGLLRRMRLRQALGFVLIQSYYPSVAFVLVSGLVLTTLHLLLGVNALEAGFTDWLGYWLPQFAMSMAVWFWLQRFFLRPGDRGWGLRGILVGLGAMVTYTEALVLSLARRPLSYVITPKGEVGVREPLRLFRWHIVSLLLSLGTLGFAVARDTGAATIRFWAVINIAQMLLVVGTGTALPGLLRTRLTWSLGLVGRYSFRVGLPLVTGALALVLAAQLAPVRPALPAARAEVSDVPANTGTAAPTRPQQPVGPVRADFLSKRSDAVALGEFDLRGELDVPAAIHEEFVDFRSTGVRRMRQTVRDAAAAGQVALITWEPKVAGRRSVSLLPRVADGRRDAYVARVAGALRDSGQPVVLRFAPEMDHARSALHPWAGGSATLYRTAWHRVHRIFARSGADNVRFAWTPGGYFAGQRFASDRWYPGDDVVDVVGFSVYSYWGWEEWNARRAARHAFRSPAQLVLPRYRAIARHGKPVIIPELGIDLHASRKGEQADWLRRFVRIADRRMPQLAGVVYYNAPHNLQDFDIDWRLTTEERDVFVSSMRRSDRFELTGADG